MSLVSKISSPGTLQYSLRGELNVNWQLITRVSPAKELALQGGPTN